MEKYTITDFEGTQAIAISSDTSYIEICDQYGNLLSDNGNARVVNNLVYLDRENFQDNDFPLSIFAFSTSASGGAIKLFEQRLGVPGYTSRLALGKRHELAKNLTVSDLFDYVNDGGAIYVNKDLQGIDFAEARENLDLYSKSEIDTIFNEKVKATTEYEFTSTNYSAGTFYGIAGSIWSPANIYFETTYKSGVLTVTGHCNAYGWNVRYGGPYELCTIAEAIGQQWEPETPVIAPVILDSFPKTFVYYGSGGYRDNAVIYSPMQMPMLIFTASPVEIGSYSLDGGKVYVFNPYATATYGNYYDFQGQLSLEWQVTYCPNDAQLD